MDDQGEKIVYLARELLNAGVPETGYGRKPVVSMTFKTLCFTTLLAAGGGGIVATAIHENGRPLNRYEKTEIQALIFYAARTKGIDEDALKREVESKIGVERLDDMTCGDFPAARRYLQEKAQ